MAWKYLGITCHNSLFTEIFFSAGLFATKLQPHLTCQKPKHVGCQLEIGLKSSIFWLSYQYHSSSANCARELFKPSKDSASLRVCNEKKVFVLGFKFFCEWHHKWGRFSSILAHVAWPRAQLLVQSILLKFSLETRLESESLIDFLAFLVQKLWSK